MNTTIVLGRLTAEPESIKGGARFNLAVDNGQDKDGNTLTTFLQITAFGKLADFVTKYCIKGKRYLVTAHIVNNNYEKNGQKIYSFSFVADRVEFADGKDTPPNGQNWQAASNGQNWPPNGQNWPPNVQNWQPNGQNWQPVNNTDLPFN